MKHFLMVFNRKTGALRMKEYADVRDAILQRLEEEQANDNPDVEIVVIGAPSLEDLKVTHSRYFAVDELPDVASYWAQGEKVS
ncbi:MULTISPECIES: hypothetical protein [Corynebacterium]|uniref:Uncharacterized protein n=1 Tax=Corynebacterium coyleae TaxID=53374 RepID=A0AAP6XKI7_9CORY|nr:MULTISPECIES: hypothetical protein [Corynebacterium]MDK6493957.1 hypothetical protein [Corynebacterium coyleae]MDK8242516.1 hypothetical protein [Corynebacterium coyleae]MDK8663638.1 hypothetical protein [Corynebacterium coyleae]MDK8706526.1 hypothetical protein [Corynebacterium coyleae]MDK8733440.1 hypothetical protein [Corynebacterium coyleae]